MSDPEAYEVEHDENLLAREEEDPVDVADGDPEEDPEEYPVEAPRESPEEEGYIFPTPTSAEEESEDDGLVWRDIHMHPLPPVRSPTPSMSPRSPSPPEEEYPEELTPDTVGDDPASPPPSPQPVISLALHDWLVNRYTVDLAAAEARVDESRLQLAAARELRHSSQSGVRDPTPRQMRREMRRIEARARSRLHALPSARGRLVHREDAESILVGAMMRARDATRSTGDH